jgi:SHS2 domain-containing protein
VAGLVESFADTTGMRPRRTVSVPVEPGTAEDGLVAVLDEVIYLLEVDGDLVLDAEVVEEDDGWMTARLEVGDVTRATPVGAVPKAVSLHDLRFTRAAGGWSCAVTVDV